MTRVYPAVIAVVSVLVQTDFVDAAPPDPSPVASAARTQRIAWQGQESWCGDIETARETAAKSGKPIALVASKPISSSPDARTVFKGDVLGHPLIQDALEHCFVPLDIDGDTTRGEARASAWLQILSARNASSIVTVDKDPTLAAISAAMVRALQDAQQEVPQYLSLLAAEATGREKGLQRVVFTPSCGCFWAGERQMGRIDGVMECSVGFHKKPVIPGSRGNKAEITIARLHPDMISLEQFLERASWKFFFYDSDEQRDIAERFLQNSKKGKRFLAPIENIRERGGLNNLRRHESGIRFVPMITVQACRANCVLNTKPSQVRPLLSPRQIALWELIQAHPDAGWENAIGATDVAKAWRGAEAVSEPLRLGGQ